MDISITSPLTSTLPSCTLRVLTFVPLLITKVLRLVFETSVVYAVPLSSTWLSGRVIVKLGIVLEPQSIVTLAGFAVAPLLYATSTGLVVASTFRTTSDVVSGR